MTDCIFCKIANHEISTEPVFENEKVIAFNDLNPQAPTHILVIPKEHVESVSDVENFSIMQDLFDAVQQITRKNGIKSFRTVINTGCDAGQTVFHLHIHILAGRPLLWPPG